MSSWTIRTATPADIDAVLALWRAGSSHALVGMHDAGLQRLLARDGDALLVAEVQGVLAGSLIAAWDGWRGNSYRLVVDVDMRRKGLATALVREGERRLWGRGVERLTAIVAEEDAGARDFWIATGYECQAGRERFVRALTR